MLTRMLARHVTSLPSMMGGTIGRGTAGFAAAPPTVPSGLGWSGAKRGWMGPAPSLHKRFASGGNDTDPELRDLLEKNEEWIKNRKDENPTYFDELGAPQTPQYLWIGCSDSRVPANQILGLAPGTVFVHRNLGNVVANSDINCQSVIEYAVDHLDVKHIIVAGHYDCGAVAGSLEKRDLGLIEHWIRNIRDVQRLHKGAFDGMTDKVEIARKMVEINVQEQCLNVYKTGVVQRKRFATAHAKEHPFAYPRVHGIVFDPKVGRIKKLDLTFKEKISEMKHIYDLYEEPKHFRDE